MILPKIEKIKPTFLDFPTIWQQIIFRNYGTVPPARLAFILGTDEKTIIGEAEKLGISAVKQNDKWLTNGYVSIIRNNWYLLSYNQITQLLAITIDELAVILKEDDFLSIKLGSFKPDVEEEKYRPLTAEQELRTKQIKETVSQNSIEYTRDYFDFLSDTPDIITFNNKDGIKDKIIFSYFALYGDSLMGEGDCSYPDILLEKYSRMNINGIWMQGLLSQLSPYPFDEEMSKGYEKRRKNLNKLIERCKKYNIKVYLYFNEPRALPESFFEKNNLTHGDGELGLYSLCTSNKYVKDYLYEASQSLFMACPDIGGIITITMSENVTHCYSRSTSAKCSCEKCSKRAVYEVASEVNNIIYAAAQSCNKNIKVIANLWGWDGFMNWDMDMTKKGISLLDKGIDVMLISENSLETEIGGIKNKVIDYSVSNVGPSRRSAELMEYAKKSGHNIFAKVQINNSWECSAVPYLPVFDLIKQHMSNLHKLNIDGLMLSWTLGGYPGGGLSYLSGICNDSDDEWYKANYGEEYLKVKKAVSAFSQAFKEFPFDLATLYLAPQNMGPANLWHIKDTGYYPTMQGYPFDGLDYWRGVYDRKTYINQFCKLSHGWKEGLDILGGIDLSNKRLKELYEVSVTCYVSFYSSYLNCLFIDKIKEYLQNKDAGLRVEISDIIEKERDNVKTLMRIQSDNPRIGYEASNHYYYNENILLEKLINLENIKKNI